ncbi:hypothetical protein J4734_24385, partial [Klebsiella pneumoniae]|nr:hypothetical protein [Klebsiella pneumoniae]
VKRQCPSSSATAVQHRAAVVNSDRRPGFRRPAQGRRRIMVSRRWSAPVIWRHIVNHRRSLTAPRWCPP